MNLVNNSSLGAIILCSTLSGCGFLDESIQDLLSQTPTTEILDFGDPDDIYYTTNSSFPFFWTNLGNDYNYQLDVYDSSLCLGTIISTSTQSTSSYSLTGMLDGHHYSVRLTVLGSQGAITSACSPTVGRDTQSPNDITFITPLAPTVIAATDYTFSWTTADNGISGLANSETYTISYYANNTCTGSPVGSITQTLTSYTLDSLTDGSDYCVKVTAKDKAGNSSTAVASSAISVDMAAPVLILSDTSSNSQLYTNSATIELNYTNIGAIHKFCVSETQTTQPSTGSAACVGGTGPDNGWFTTTPPTTFNLSAGSGTKQVYLWTANASDSVRTVPSTPSIMLDLTNPTISITAHPNDPTNATSASFSFSSSDAHSGVSSIECQIDGGAWSACTSPKNYTGLNHGSHTFTVRIIDNAENIITDSYTWEIDTAPPTAVTFTTPASNSTTTNNSYDFTWSASTDADSGLAATNTYLVEYFTNGDCTGTATGTQQQTGTSYSYLGLTSGSAYSIRVTAYDSAGNTSITTCSPTLTKMLALTVAAVYPIHGANWNYYVKISNPSIDNYNQTDTECVGTETGYYYTACIHGGEKRKVEVTGITSCTNLTLTDSLNAFDWICDDSSGTAVFYSSGLKDGKGLADLVDPSEWKNNKVTLYSSSVIVGESSNAKWWTNSVVPLPDNSASANITLDGIDSDGSGPDEIFTEGTVFTLNTSRSSNGYNLNLHRLSLVTLSSTVLSYGGSVDFNVNLGSGEIVAANRRTVVGVGGQNFIWIEAALDAYHAVTPAQNSLMIASGKFNVIRRTTLRRASENNFYLRGTTDSKGLIQDVITEYASDMGIFFATSGTYWTLKRVTSRNNGGVGIYLTSSNFIVENCITTSNGSYGLRGEAGRNLTLTGHKSYLNGNHGIVFTGYHNSSLTNIQSAANSGSGLSFSTPSSGFKINGAKLFNNTYNLYLNPLRDSILTNILLAGSSNVSLIIAGASNRLTMSHITVVNSNNDGISIQSADNTFNQLVTAQNASEGIYIYNTTGNLISQLVSANNNAHGIVLHSATNNIFTENLLVGSNSGNQCYLNSSPTGGLNSDCSNEGASNAVLKLGVNLTWSFVNKVTDNDILNVSDINGMQLFDSIMDWFSFDYSMRTWGKEGSAMPNFDNSGICSTTTNCRIWDWRLVDSISTPIIKRSGNGSNDNDAFTPGLPCPNAVDGSRVITDKYNLEVYDDGVGDDDGLCEAGETCELPNTFLVNAFEIIDDNIGDNDGLCESNEACVYSPNFGVYQGEGDYLPGGTCDFQDDGDTTPVINIQMYSYPVNGAPAALS